MLPKFNLIVFYKNEKLRTTRNVTIHTIDVRLCCPRIKTIVVFPRRHREVRARSGSNVLKLCQRQR